MAPVSTSAPPTPASAPIPASDQLNPPLSTWTTIGVVRVEGGSAADADADPRSDAAVTAAKARRHHWLMCPRLRPSG